MATLTTAASLRLYKTDLQRIFIQLFGSDGEVVAQSKLEHDVALPSSFAAVGLSDW